MKAYIAGPDVFYSDAKARAQQAKEAAKKYGIEAFCPCDYETAHLKPEEMSKVLFDVMVEHIDAADVVIANVSPFRGPSADAGTIWEIGYAYGKGRKIFAFSDNLLPYKDRVPVKDDGTFIEDFQLVDNLMIAHALESISPSVEEALKAASETKGQN